MGGVPFDPAAILDQLATPLVLLDDDARIAWANPAFARWIGYAWRRFHGEPAAVLAAGDDMLAQLVARARERGIAVRAPRLRIAPASEHERFADATVVPLAEGGLLLELVPVAEFPGADPATAMPAALHEALKGLAHEVKNPLAGLRGAAQLLARRLADADARRYLDVITAEADRLVDLVERLLNPAPPRPPEPVNVHVVLERVRLLAEAEAGWSVLIHRDYDPSLPELTGDADRLTQSLWNLVRNAIQAGSSEVRLRTRAESNVMIGERHCRLALRIDVADNGRGVPEDLAARIFLPLVSGRAEGSGLGLTLAQQVAREHGGMLSYRSRPGHTVFTLLLPVADAA
jgi:two-component system nitrogen regulation sensor histidine kinase GlnL